MTLTSTTFWNLTERQVFLITIVYFIELQSQDHSIVECVDRRLLRTWDYQSLAVSFLAHASNINDLLEGLDGVLENGLDGLHDTESSLHIVDLGLHALDGLHLSGDLNEGLSVIESLEDSSGKGLLDVLDGSGLGNGGIRVTSGLGGLSGGEGGLKGRQGGHLRSWSRICWQ